MSAIVGHCNRLGKNASSKGAIFESVTRLARTSMMDAYAQSGLRLLHDLATGQERGELLRPAPRQPDVVPRSGRARRRGVLRTETSGRPVSLEAGQSARS